MKKVKINFDKLAAYWKPIHPQILFIRPFVCKTFRVCHISDTHHITGKYKDIEDVLNATATRKHNGIWYFLPGDDGLMEETILSLKYDIGVEVFMVEEEIEFGRDKYNEPILEILN